MTSLCTGKKLNMYGLVSFLTICIAVSVSRCKDSCTIHEPIATLFKLDKAQVLFKATKSIRPPPPLPRGRWLSKLGFELIFFVDMTANMTCLYSVESKSRILSISWLHLCFLFCFLVSFQESLIVSQHQQPVWVGVSITN